MRRTAFRREMRARHLHMTLGFSIASPLALVAGASMLKYVTVSATGRIIFILPLVAATLVLFGVGIPIDLLHDRIRRKRELQRRSTSADHH